MAKRARPDWECEESAQLLIRYRVKTTTAPSNGVAGVAMIRSGPTGSSQTVTEMQAGLVVTQLLDREIHKDNGDILVCVCLQDKTGGWVRLQDLEKLPHDASIGAPFIDVKSYEVVNTVNLEAECAINSYKITEVSEGEIVRLPVPPVPLCQTVCGIIRALVITQSNLVGWISVDRCSRGLPPLVKPTPLNKSSKSAEAASTSSRRSMSTSQWQDQVKEVLRQAAALRTRMETLQTQDPKPTCKVCVDATADTAYKGCGHVVCEDCARASKACPFCRQASGFMKIHWD